MFEVNEVVVYRKEVYRIVEKKKNPLNKEEMYILVPYFEKEGLTTRLQVPAANRMGYLRKLSTYQEINELIEKIPAIPVIEGTSRFIENDYRNKLKNASLEDLVSIIKTTWLRNQERIEHHKKMGAIDDSYFQQAEKYLYSEIAAVLQISQEAARNYVAEKVSAS